MKPRFPIAILCLLFITLMIGGCAPLPDGPGTRLTEEPKLSELAGTYELTAESLALLRSFGFSRELMDRKHLIHLKADGSCTYEGAVSYNKLSPKEDRRSIEAAGSWRLSTEKHGVDYVVLNLDLRTNAGEGVLQNFRLARFQGHYVFWTWASDPDDQTCIIFEEREANPRP